MKAVTVQIRPAGFREDRATTAIFTTSGGNVAVVVEPTTTGVGALFAVAQICSLPGNQVIPMIGEQVP